MYLKANYKKAKIRLLIKRIFIVGCILTEINNLLNPNSFKK
jgi:hypothetical protein